MFSLIPPAGETFLTLSADQTKLILQSSDPSEAGRYTGVNKFILHYEPEPWNAAASTDDDGFLVFI